jgi:prephenate dehydratase
VQTPRITVGFQGAEGAFSDEAARLLVGNARYRGYETFDDLVAAVDRKEIDYGLLPVENTIFGPIARSYDLLSECRNVRIVEEYVHPVSQCLVGLSGADLTTIARVTSHPVALEQCRRFLRGLPAVTPVVAYDTAASVAAIVERGDPAHAAIAPAGAAARYGAAVLAAGIQDDAENYTRFFLVERDGHPRRNSRKCCMALTLPHARGALRDALAVLADAGCNLTALVARPDRQSVFNYVFYIEVACEATAQPLDVLRRLGSGARLLGTY